MNTIPCYSCPGHRPVFCRFGLNAAAYLFALRKARGGRASNVRLLAQDGAESIFGATLAKRGGKLEVRFTVREI
jgi:hypothetical protein